MLLNETTRKIWLFGCPVGRSLSPVMYNAAFRHLGLNWRYEAVEVAPKDLREAFDCARSSNVIGLNITVPHKMAAVAVMDQLDETARCVGAVNTVVVEPTGRARQADAVRFIGYNTDGYGLVEALREEFQLELKGKTVGIIGAGGAGRAAAFQCALEGVHSLWVFNRTTEKAEQLTEAIRRQFPSVQAHVGFPRGCRIDLVINATSLGMRPSDPSPVSYSQLEGVPYVFDMVYRPAETRFLEEARKSGAKTANGLSMLLHQGVRALELWLSAHAFGCSFQVPTDVMRAALKNICRSE